MKKTILIIISVLLNVSFILLFIFSQSNSSNKKEEKAEAIVEMQEKLDAKNSELESFQENRLDLNSNKEYSKTEFYDNSQIKYKKLVGRDGRVVESYFFQNGDIEKERTSLDSKPYEEVVYYQNGNRKRYSVYEQENIVNITTNYPNGQIESQGRKTRSNGKNDMYYGRWIWYNQDGTIRDEKNFN